MSEVQARRVSETRLDAFARAVQALARAADRDGVVEAVRRAAREISGASGVSISLRDGDECVHVAEDADYGLWTGQRFLLEDCISGWAMLSGQQAVVPDIYADPRVPHAAYRATPITGLIMTPVGEPQPFAALGAYWTADGHLPDGAAELLRALGAVMGSTLRQLEVHEALTRHHAEAERQQALLINELNHRVKNTLAIVQGVARQTLRNADSLGVARESFEARLHALAAAHSLLTDIGWRPVMLRDLLGACTAAFGGIEGGPFELDGPDLKLPPNTAAAFALAIHELGTNASKYGALSVETGRVSIRWWLVRGEDGSRLRLLWRETEGPPVCPPTRRGFGSRLLERGLARELKGSVALRFDEGGVTCHIDAPAPSSASEE